MFTSSAAKLCTITTRTSRMMGRRYLNSTTMSTGRIFTDAVTSPSRTHKLMSVTMSVRSIRSRQMVRSMSSNSSSSNNNDDVHDDEDEAVPNEAELASEKVQVSKEVEDIVDQILKLNVVELGQLSNLFAERLGFDKIDMSAGMVMGGGGGADNGDSEGEAEAAPKEEKTLFELKLTGFDAKSKIKVIKEVRSITGLGLKEAKELVEGAPASLKKDIKKEEAEELKAKMEAVGATLEIE